jgi:hypothetical protein
MRHRFHTSHDRESVGWESAPSRQTPQCFIPCHGTRDNSVVAGVVLVGFVAERMTPEFVEQMDITALVHALATGCPLERVVD